MSDISIIVPIYNSEKTINKCIDSLLNQTKKELEFIIINDGSTDNTHDIISKIKDDRIKYFNNKNQGIGKTRNFGIEKSSSKYIMFLDSDDYLVNDACEKLFNEIEKRDLDILVFDYFNDLDGKIEENKIIDFEDGSLKDNSSIITNINLAAWNKIYKKEIIKNIKFDEQLKYEDVPFVLKSLKESNKIGKLNDNLLYYYIHQNSETTVRDKRIFDIFKILDDVRNYYKEDYKKEIDELTISIIMNYNIQCRYIKDKSIRNKFINDSFKYFNDKKIDYKKSVYFKNRKILKKIIEKNKNFTKIYCNIYSIIKM